MVRLVRHSWSLWITFGFLATVFAGNTTCIDNHLDWYTSVVGETPCTTYERLRRICNSQYQVPDFRPNTPGDNCDDQLHDCCCNSISWALSMLCMNCQQFQAPNGIDAGKTAYTLYRTQSDGSLCLPGTNKTLPDNIQAAVCNANIRLDNFLYDIFWDGGDWFYEYTREAAGEEHVQNNNNVFTHCANQISTSTPTPTSTLVVTSHSPTSTLGNNTSTANGMSAEEKAVIGGGIAGGLALIALLGAALWMFCRRRNRILWDSDLNKDYISMPITGMPDPNSRSVFVTPYVVANDATHQEPPSTTFTRKPSKTQRGTYSSPQNTSSTPSSSRMTSSQSPPSSTTSRPGASSDVPRDRHQDGGSVMVALERSASGRLPPAYMSWNPNENLRPTTAPQSSQTTPQSSQATPQLSQATPQSSQATPSPVSLKQPSRDKR